MDDHSLELLEYPMVTAAIAARAEGVGAREALARWRPLPDRESCARENLRLAEAMRRVREPGSWCSVGPGSLGDWLDRDAPPDGPALVEVMRWLEAAEATIQSWSDPELRDRFPRLLEVVETVVPPRGLRARLANALDPDGRVRDQASPALARMRRELGENERRLEQKLERWARGFGSDAYVTRHADRFVALVPAAGFPRRRGIVHDVSSSGQSLFVEPLEACAENNQLLELRSAAGAEERRILLELAGEVIDAAESLRATEAALIRLDGLRARALWGAELGGIAITPGGEQLTLRNARHPMLEIGARRAESGRQVIPLDLDLGQAAAGAEGVEGARLLLVSGPNMGGKTVLLKTVGLSVAMSRSALPVIAAEGSRLPWLDRIVVDLGDEQSVERGLSTFAAHLEVLGRMASHAGPETLVLCDEMGAGTDPEEGGALAQALIEHFASRGTWGVVTTHLGSLKSIGSETAGVMNGSLEFDAETLSPSYRFIPGVPGASHALEVAERLGFPPSLLERARALTPESAHALERLTADLVRATREAREQAQALAQARAEAETAATTHREATETTRRELSERRRALARESETLVGRARELWQTLEREARKGAKSRADVARLGEEMRTVEQSVDALAVDASAPAPETLPAEAVQPGRTVRVLDLGVEAEVITEPDREGRVTLRRGNWSIQSHVERLAPAAAEAAPARPSQPVAARWESPETAPLEVDLRGMEVDEAVTALDGGLDQAMRAGLAELRVIHGIGRGILRGAVEKHLRGHPLVAEQRMGKVGEGGRGVTVAKLK